MAMEWNECSVCDCIKRAIWEHSKRVGDIVIFAGSCEDHYSAMRLRLDAIKSPETKEGFNDSHVAA